MTPPLSFASFSFALSSSVFSSASSLSRASRAAAALSMASFHSESLRWQAAMLDLRTAIS